FTTSSSENPKTACTTTKGTTAGPNTAIVAPKSTTDRAQALSTSLLSDQTRLPLRRWAAAAIDQAECRLPATVRGRKAQKDSPSRALAGSSGVDTLTWWPRLCST